MKLNLALPVCKYNTPKPIVDVIAKHTPKNISTLLDPAVGEGALLHPFINKNIDSLKRVVCVDIENTALKQVYSQYKSKLGNSLEVYNSDFIKWSSTLGAHDENFDCIVMNPPYCGRNDVLIKTNMKTEFPDVGSNCRHVPIEIAFILRSIRLLKPSGKLFAVLPPSLISSERMGWVRNFMLKMGAVHYVYEFPKYSFKGVEGRTYLLIFQKSVKQSKLIVSSRDSNSNSRLMIRKSVINSTNRFDYDYNLAHRKYCEIITSSPLLKWEKATNLLNVFRGSIDTPLNGKAAIHTSNYRDNRWECEQYLNTNASDKSLKSIKKGDLLVKRVGRDCSQSIGSAAGLDGYNCTDCIFILRPHDQKMSLKILLALRVIVNSTIGAKLIERGVGAKYISIESLSSLMIPHGVFKVNPKRFKRYKNAVKNKDYDSMLQIEKTIRLDYNFSS